MRVGGPQSSGRKGSADSDRISMIVEALQVAFGHMDTCSHAIYSLDYFTGSAYLMPVAIEQPTFSKYHASTVVS
jgi:hypothetical protein